MPAGLLHFPDGFQGQNPFSEAETRIEAAEEVEQGEGFPVSGAVQVILQKVAANGCQHIAVLVLLFEDAVSLALEQIIDIDMRR